MTKFNVKSGQFEPFTILVDSQNHQILNKDHSVLGSIQNSKKKESSLANGGVFVPIKKMSQVKSQVNKLTKDMQIDNYKYIAYSLIAMAICVSISYGLPKVINAAKEFNHQGVIDEIAGAEVYLKKKYAKALLNISTLSISIPISYILERRHHLAAVLGAFGAIAVLGLQ